MSRGFIVEPITIRFGIDRMKQLSRGHVSRFNAKKGIVTIVWTSAGFHGIRVLPSGRKFTSTYYIQQNEMLGPLLEWRSEQAGAASRRLSVHADNARLYTAAGPASQKFMEENAMIRVTHPVRPYSLDSARSDFCLFGNVKHCLRGESCEAANELFSLTEAILRGTESQH
jgi:hypothetical protein